MRKKKIKVALVSTIQPETHYTRYLADALQGGFEKDLDLLLYVDKDPKNKKTVLKNVKLVWTKGFFYLFQVIKQAFIDRPDIVHIQQEMNMYGTPFTVIVFPLLIFLLFILRIRTVVTFHAVVASEQIDLKFLQTFSWPEKRRFLLPLRFVFAYLYKTTGLFANGVIVHSNYARNILVESYCIKRDKIISIPIGVSIAQLDNLEKVFLGKSLGKKMNKKKMILFFGYILKRKGLDYLIRVFNEIAPRYPDYILVLAGGILDYQKNYATNLKKKIKNFGLEKRVIFTPFLTQPQIEKFYHLCHFVVLPYIYSISSSLPLSFAIQHHKPVIATSIGSLKEEIEDGEDGILCPPEDTVCLRKAMEKLIENKKFYQKLVSGMKKKHKNRLWKKTARQTYFFYKKIL